MSYDYNLFSFIFIVIGIIAMVIGSYFLGKTAGILDVRKDFQKELEKEIKRSKPKKSK